MLNRKIVPTPGEVGLTRAVTALQQHLFDELPWLEVNYGLASDGYAVNAEQLTLTVPEVYVGNGEYDLVLPDDRHASQVFYYADGPEEVTDQGLYAGYRLRVPLSIVVWLDLDKLTRAMGYAYDYRYADELKARLLGALNQYGDFEAESVEGKAARVWSGWNVGRGILYFGDIKEYAISQVGKHPQAGFRVRGTLTYAQEC